MVERQQRRFGTAVGFLFGVLACLNSVRDAKVLWPPDALWAVLNRPQRLQLVSGVALILITLLITILRSRET
jgi:hypothetical protein